MCLQLDESNLIVHEKNENTTIWCRLEENGGFVLIRTHSATTSERLVQELNEIAEPGRRYFAFPQGLNAKVLSNHTFALVVLQAVEDHLKRPTDTKYLRIKEQVINLALNEHGMENIQIEMIEKEANRIFSVS
ncbi:hypothetical protein OB236_14540 [Paenibacillus sp. WQ 127069]|uniref:Uncharacterized protein n=1 Tax=Paenibacillus baimaensis TaxID=2982185 RepID=A0ABT2UI42_9BACL|nr:hypothetical protein [Paenibacillus sp. WQ 127069]MCU6793329.1 hypothetical protein [Paenibacillus sp. WQ 127069]